jgi:hypothetical protein
MGTDRVVTFPAGPELNLSQDERHSPPLSPNGSLPNGHSYGHERSNSQGKTVQIHVTDPEGVPTVVTFTEGDSVANAPFTMESTSPGVVDDGAGVSIDTGAATGARLPGERSRIQRLNASSTSIITVDRMQPADYGE